MAASKLPTIDCTGFEALRAVGGSGRPVFSSGSRGDCGCDNSFSVKRVAIGEASGDGDNDGNEVKLLSEGVGA